MRPRLYHEEDILKLHAEGFSSREIAQKLKLTNTGPINRIIRAAGLEPIKKTKTEKARDELIIKQADAGETIETIRKKSKMSDTHIRDVLKNNGLTTETDFQRKQRETNEQIKLMRLNHATYPEIAKTLEISRKKVEKFCIKNSLTYSDDEVKAYLIERSNASEIAEKLKALNVGLEYVGGYIAKQKPMTVRKISCGHEFEIQWHSLTVNKRDDVPCPICRQEKQNQRQAATKIRRESYIKNCTVCGKLMDGQPKSSRKYCSKECAIKAHTIRQTAELKAKFVPEAKTCAWCGKEYQTQFKWRSQFCSEDCQKEYLHERSKKRLEGKTTDKGISLRKVYDRDGGICQICGEACDWQDCYRNDNGAFIAGRKYPSIDHIKPLSKGGLHSWSNVQLACFICNSIKSDTYQEVV